MTDVFHSEQLEPGKVVLAMLELESRVKVEFILYCLKNTVVIFRIAACF